MTEETNLSEEINNPIQEEIISDLHQVKHVQTMYENWFLDYASYVILDRAIPDVIDGLKPVQRRILHSMDELEDGRYNKVANIIGNTMKYHPHGDRSIGDAIVQLGQKMIAIDTQGNWGNIYTGDSAAAARYIEARLSKFANEVCFNHKTTEWKLSYDGRNKEPITLPIKYPLLLAQGVEGIAVGLNTKILPHNFIELIDASIAILKHKDFEIYPDFPTGGSVDVSKYNDGMRGGKIRNRAKISIVDKKMLVITEIPFGTNTSSLITDSIAPAIEKGKLKIKKIDDNTAAQVEIVLHLYPGVSPDQTIDALYAFTDCEMSYSPNACVLHDGKPKFLSVKDILHINTDHTVHLLKRELEIQLEELENDWHKWSLEKIFFEKRIYKELEKDTTTWDNQVENIERAFDPYRPLLKREITKEDVLKLCEKPVRKISKFDIKKAEEQIASIEELIKEVLDHLNHLVDYAIKYFSDLKKKYGEGKERKTELKSFDTIVAAEVAVANQKLYVNKKEGFVGIALKKDDAVEYVCDCSDIDEIVVIREDGKFSVSKVSEKQFFGKDILHVEVFKRNDDRTIYNLVYSDGLNGMAMVKRFAIGGVTRDKEYDLTKGKSGSKIVYLTSNPNGEAEKVKVYLKAKAKIKKLQFDFDFSSLAIKGRASQGNILSRHAVRKIELSEKGVSTLSAINIYFDSTVMRLNTDERGDLLGAFKENDKIVSIYKAGYYRITGFEISTHFDDSLVIIQKYNPKKPVTVIYQNLKEDKYYMKRFLLELTDKNMEFLAEDKNLKILHILHDYLPQIKVDYYIKNKEDIESAFISCEEFVELMSIKARGKRINNGTIKKISVLEPMPFEEPEIIEEIDDEMVEEDQMEDTKEEVVENLDYIIAKEIFDTIDTHNKPENKEAVEIKERKVFKKKEPSKDEDEWEQLTLF